MRYGWLWVVVVCACSSHYVNQPISQAENISQIQATSPSEDGFRQFVIQRYPGVSLPIQQWNLDTLTLSALYFHPALKVAKSDYAVAMAGITTAAQLPKVGINGNLDKSNQANGDINPWAYGLQVDLPIITANKRQLNIEVARHQAEIARIAIGETAWTLRQQLQLDLITRAELQGQVFSLGKLQAVQSQLLNAYQKRLEAGLAGKPETLQIRLQYDQSSWQLQQLQVQLNQTEQKIIPDAGLTGHALDKASIASINISQMLKMRLEPPASPLQLPDIQHQALTNRMDIQRGLAQYARADAQLRLDIARLYPDLSLSPGILYDYGDRIWSLGVGGMLNLLNKNSDLWAHAEQVRANEATRFYALQQQVIQQSEQTLLKYQQSAQVLTTHTREYQRQSLHLQQLQQQFQQGLIDKTEWLQANIQFYSAQQRLVTQQGIVLRALLDIENLVQKPLLSSEASAAMWINPNQHQPLQ